MEKNNSYQIKSGASEKAYQVLIDSLYKNYPGVAQMKVAEYKKIFSANNPFFQYGTAENYFIFKNSKVAGHAAAIADSRSGDIGFVGFFECENNQKYANVLFAQAAEFLKNAGKKQFRGPINTSVWQNFRVSYPENNPPFYLEPFTLGYYKNLFLQNEFAVSHQNITTTELINKTQIKNYKDSYDQSIENGYTYELLNKKNAVKSIRDIYSLTNQIFTGSYSFYKISEKEFSYFAQSYLIVPKSHYIFILKNKKNKPIGFFLALPDIFNPQLKRVVLKTMGILPEYRGLGLSKAMLYFVYQNAKKDEFKELVFSTMAVANERIQQLTGQKLNLYRRYEVYEKNII